MSHPTRYFTGQLFIDGYTPTTSWFTLSSISRELYDKPRILVNYNNNYSFIISDNTVYPVRIVPGVRKVVDEHRWRGSSGGRRGKSNGWSVSS